MGFDKTPRDRLIETIGQALKAELWDTDHNARSPEALSDLVATVFDALLAHPEDVIALLGGERTDEGLNPHYASYRFSREETP